jgi:adenosylmethionine-8-amino-7-oxononanoate aminotransferase
MLTCDHEISSSLTYTADKLACAVAVIAELEELAAPGMQERKWILRASVKTRMHVSTEQHTAWVFRRRPHPV